MELGTATGRLLSARAIELVEAEHRLRAPGEVYRYRAALGGRGQGHGYPGLWRNSSRGAGYTLLMRLAKTPLNHIAAVPGSREPAKYDQHLARAVLIWSLSGFCGRNVTVPSKDAKIRPNRSIFDDRHWN
jgi:hypothetical protein